MIIGSSALRTTQKNEENETQRGTSKAALKTTSKVALEIKFLDCNGNELEGVDWRGI